MNVATQRPLVAFVAHARRVPAPERERFASTLRAELNSGALILETCHRVEAYLARPDGVGPAEPAIRVPAGGRVLAGAAAVRHAVMVATGRDSVVVGEDQILHQIRESLDASRRSGRLDPEVDRLFALALHAGRRTRSWRSGRQPSLADHALRVVEHRIGPVRGNDILVVGAGQMGELAARAAAAAGARVSIANRSIARAEALALATGGRVSDFDPGLEVGGFAAILVALGGPWAIGPITIETLVERSPVVVDLSVPAAVPQTVLVGLGDRIVTADDLATLDDGRSHPDRVPDPRTDELIERTVQTFLDWQARGDARSAADALVRRADLEREAELAELWRKLPTLEPEAREAIERMTRHLAARLLRQPLERLGRDSEGVDGRTVRDLFAL